MSKNYTVKYLVVGDSGVGKTSLLMRYCEDTFQHEYLSTIGVDFKIKRVEVDGCPITLNIWDTAGQQRFRNITKSFYKGAHGIILVYSITDVESFEHIGEWVEQIRENGNEGTEIILVGCKADLEGERKVSENEGRRLAEQYQMEFFESSAQNDYNVNEIFETLTGTIASKHQLPSTSTQQQIKGPTHKSKSKKQCCS